MRTLTAVAHRGDPYRVRENTLPSLRSALDQGADAVEIDVRLTRDDVPVLLHDETLKRLWDHDRPLASLSAAEVGGLTGGGVPTLAEALGTLLTHRAAPAAGAASASASASGNGEPRVMVDLPAATPAGVRRIIGMVRDCGAEDRAYYCAGAETMLAVRATDPAAEIALTWTTLAPPRPALLDAVKPRWLNYRFPLVDRDLVARVHHDGRLLAVWTPDTRRSMRRLLDMGVDSITTNRIDVLHGLRDA